MKKCPKCEVSVLNDRLTCPLCHSVLLFEEANERYQGYPKYVVPIEKNHLLKKMILFFGIIAIIISLVINYLTFNDLKPSYWSSIVVAGVLLGLVIALVTILSNLPITIKVILPMIFVEILSLTIEINVHKFWSFYYLIPFMVIAFLMTIFILHLTLEIKGKELIFDLVVFDVIALIVSFVFLIRRIKISWPYMILFSFTFIMLLIVFFFFWKSLKEEFSKKMHL